MSERNLHFGLQLYSVREDCRNDLPGVLKSVAEMGYESVEFAGYHGFSAEELKQMLDDNGLQVCGTHTGIDTLLGDEFEKTVDFNGTIGNRFLIVPGLSEQYTCSADAWRKTACIFNEIAEKAASAEMMAGYHNHHTEFTEMNGELPLVLFLDNTTDNVVMQFDNGNALHGGYDINPLIEKYPGRAKTVHCKEYASGYGKALPGEGDIPWRDFFRVCMEKGGTEWYIIEQESYAFPPMECAAKALENIRNMQD